MTAVMERVDRVRCGCGQEFVSGALLSAYTLAEKHQDEDRCASTTIHLLDLDTADAGAQRTLDDRNVEPVPSGPESAPYTDTVEDEGTRGAGEVTAGPEPDKRSIENALAMRPDDRLDPNPHPDAPRVGDLDALRIPTRDEILAEVPVEIILPADVAIAQARAALRKRGDS